eukprot:673225-Pleurochrysis_carterae.AAC.1
MNLDSPSWARVLNAPAAPFVFQSCWRVWPKCNNCCQPLQRRQGEASRTRARGTLLIKEV